MLVQKLSFIFIAKNTTFLCIFFLPVRILQFFCDVIELIPESKGINKMLLAIRCYFLLLFAFPVKNNNKKRIVELLVQTKKIWVSYPTVSLE